MVTHPAHPAGSVVPVILPAAGLRASGDSGVRGRDCFEARKQKELETPGAVGREDAQMQWQS